MSYHKYLVTLKSGATISYEGRHRGPMLSNKQFEKIAEKLEDAVCVESIQDSIHHELRIKK